MEKNLKKNVCVYLVAQLCSIFYDPKDSSPPGSSVHGDSPGKNTGVGCHALLQGFFPTQGSNPGLPHYRWILPHMSHRGSPKKNIYEKKKKNIYEPLCYTHEANITL